MTDPRPPQNSSRTDDDRTLDMRQVTGDEIPAGLEVAGYTLVRKLGAGGMGVVYLAEQARPRRAVALKIVRGGPAADEVSLRMFQREADMLARLRHPDIAALYEVGRTATGQHYLTMELVQGPTLAEWLRRPERGRPSSEPEMRLRLAMFSRICATVHYAHQRGVIHRDLKPSNLIVIDEPASGSQARAGGAPRVVILDFGLARVVDTDAPGEYETMMSEAGSIRGTLAYMSPEQALGQRDQIDVRTDVYSLGVILYEMLTGARPYQLEGRSLLDAIKVISEQPAGPLSRTWGGGGRPDPDLETIVARTLSKEPADRYGSAASLGEDVDRYLTSQPILARPPSTMYQLRKLIARRKAPFAVAGAGLLLIVASAVGMGALYVRAERDRARAVTAEKTARAEALTARRTADFLVDLFDGASPERARGETITAREVIDVGARRIERELAGEPRLQARLMTTIGGVYRNLALFDESLRLINGGLELREKNLPADDPEIVASYVEQGRTLQELGQLPAAEAAFRAGLDRLRRTSRPDTSELVRALGVMGDFLIDYGRLAEGRALIDSALALHRTHGRSDDPTTLDLLYRKAGGLLATADLAGAQTLLEDAVATSRRVHGDLSPMTANLLSSLATALSREQHPDQAEVKNREVLAIREQLYGPDHPLVAQALGNLGISLAEQGRFAEARPLIERGGAIMEKVLGPEHPIIATGLTNLGLMNLQLGDPDRAVPLLERAREIRERKVGPDDPSLALTLYHLAGARMARREYATARGLMERVVAIDSKALGPNHPDVADDIEGLIEVLNAMGDRSGIRSLEARMNAIRAAAAKGDSTGS